MKRKLLIASLVIASLLATYAISQTVSGQNWVGYVKIPAPPAGELDLIAVNFEAVGSSGGGIPLNELLNTNNLVGDDRRVSRRDIVYLWDKQKQGYSLYSYNAGDFYNELDEIDNAIVYAGDAMWFQSSALAPADRDVYALGQVNLAASTAVEYTEGLQLSSYPYPADMVFTNIDWLAESATGSRRASRADQIYLFTGSGYDAYYLNEYGNWTDGVDEISVLVEPGKGFWYYSQALYTNTYDRPFSDN